MQTQKAIGKTANAIIKLMAVMRTEDEYTVDGVLEVLNIDNLPIHIQREVEAGLLARPDVLSDPYWTKLYFAVRNSRTKKVSELHPIR